MIARSQVHPPSCSTTRGDLMPRITTVSTASAGSAASKESNINARGWANVLAGVPLFAELNRRHLNKVAALGDGGGEGPGRLPGDRPVQVQQAPPFGAGDRGRAAQRGGGEAQESSGG